MSIDSYSEIMEMQRQALSRAQNISRQEKSVLESEKPKPVKRTADFVPREPKHTSLPLNIPKPKTEQEQENMLSFPDTDRAMLLSVLLLLKSEGADEMLLLALLYILA